jgi:Ca2+/H+ antiporter, TMEM165/GDT1 family
MKAMKSSFWVRKIIGFVVMGAIMILALGFVVMTIWNNVLTAVLHVSPIAFGQALAIFVLAKILFGGFRGGWRGGRPWNREMREKWSKMSPEEKERLKQDIRNRCNRWRRPEHEAPSTTNESASPLP